MKELNENEILEVAGGQNNGYWENDNWNNNNHNDWANQWHQAGLDAWNNRHPDRGYPGY